MDRGGMEVGGRTRMHTDTHMHTQVVLCPECSLRDGIGGGTIEKYITAASMCSRWRRGGVIFFM